MCGRIRQAREPVEYEESMDWNARDLGNLADGLRYNMTPPGGALRCWATAYKLRTKQHNV